jgi:hypothetical protein
MAILNQKPRREFAPALGPSCQANSDEKAFYLDSPRFNLLRSKFLAQFFYHKRLQRSVSVKRSLCHATLQVTEKCPA